MRPQWLILAGVVAGVLVVLAAAAFVMGIPGSSSPSTTAVELTFPAVEHDPDAAAALATAWERWRTATFVSVGTWSRRLDGSDSPLTGESYTAQDPPRRLVTRLGAVTEQIDGDITRCDGPTDDLIVPGCTELTDGSTYAERVAVEMSLVVQYVTGDTRIYDVAEVDGCFQVELLAVALRSPWGRAAQFCFDPATGALTSSRVRRQSATDLESIREIRAEVTDADFSMRGGGG